MPLVLDIASWMLLLGGGIFCLIGAVGLLRLPDVFARVHAAGLIDSLGVALILAGLMLQSALDLTLAKLVLILAFLLLTGPTATHALARAALHGGVEPQLGTSEKRPAEGPTSNT